MTGPRMVCRRCFGYGVIHVGPERVEELCPDCTKQEPAPAPEQTPMDRLRDIGLAPNVPRDELRRIVADAVQEVQDRLQQLETEQRDWRRRLPRRRPRERP